SGVPAVLRLEHRPFSQRQREKRIAKAFAEGRREAGDRPPEDGASLPLEILQFALRPDVFKLLPRRCLVGWRRQVESYALWLVKPLVILRKPGAELLFRRRRHADLVENQQL